MIEMTLSLRWNRSVAVVVILLSLVAFTVVGMNISAIFRNRGNHINESVIKCKAQAQLLGENTSEMLYIVDFALISIVSMMERQTEPKDVTSPDAQSFIRQEVRFLPQIKNVVFLNPQEEVIFNIAPVEAFTLASFKDHRDAWLPHAVETIFAGDHESNILLSRRVENKRGDFIGVLVAVIDAAYFYGRFDDYLNVDANAVVLYDGSGRVLTGWFNLPGQANLHASGADVLSIPFFSSLFKNRLVKGGWAAYQDSHAIMSTYQIRGFSYHIAVMQTMENILIPWQRQTRRDVSMLVAVVSVAIFAMILAFRQSQRRSKAEFALYQYQQDLENMVGERTRQLDEANEVLTEKNNSLEKALNEIKTLKGIVPICSYCKNIRDDKGYWEKVEVYVKRHSHADFSHGICPQCAEKHFPGMGLYDEGESESFE